MGIYTFERDGIPYVLEYRSSYEPERGRGALDTITYYNLRNRETNKSVKRGSAWSNEDNVIEAILDNAFRD